MSVFKIKFKDRRGRDISTEITADNESIAREIIRKRGKLISIKKKLFDIEFAMTPGERQTFLRNLSTLLASRKGASDALRAIEYSFSGTIKKVSAKMLLLLENGVSLINALETTCAKKHFPETTLALIKAGERSGKTWKALRDAAEFELEMEEMKKGSNKDIYIAVFGFLFAMIVVLAVEFKFKAEFVNSPYIKMLGATVDLTIVEYMSFFTLLSMSIIGSCFIFLLILGTIGKKIFPFLADKIILKIPFYNTLVLSRNNYITLYGLSLMVSSGVSMERSLHLAERSAAKGSLKNDLKNATMAVKKGKPWPPYMTTFHEVDKAALDGAVDKSQIGNILHHLARNNRDTYKQVAQTVGPVLQFLAAFYVIMSGAILFGYTMLPMLQASSQAFG